MKISEYQELAKGTALPGAWSMNYLAPGLCAEVGEAMEKKFSYAPMVNLSGFMEELADIYWFVALIAEHLGWSLENQVLDCMGFDSLEHVQTHLLKTDFNAEQEAFSLVIAAANLAGAWAKAVRDDEGQLITKRELTTRTNLVRVFFSVTIIAVNLGYQVSDLFEMNIEKLYGRKERGVLGGDGDNR